MIVYDFNVNLIKYKYISNYKSKMSKKAEDTQAAKTPTKRMVRKAKMTTRSTLI